MLLWVMLACTRREPYYPPEDSSAPVDTDVADDSGEAVVAYPWEDAAFWTEPGPFAPLLDPTKIPTGPHWETWMFSSPDGRDWDDGVLVAHSLSSLDLLVLEQGVILGGSTFYNEDLGVNAPLENYFALVSADLKTWGSHLLPVLEATHRQIVDPSLHIDPGGEVRMVFYGAPDDVDPKKNPEEYEGAHPIYTATWTGEGFTQAPEPLLSADALVDPSGCTWQGAHHLLATGERTLFSARADAVGGDYDTHPPEGWSGVQVPYCFIDGDTQQILVQTGGGFGSPAAITRTPGGSFSEPSPIVDIKTLPFNTCTSPVMGRFQGQYILFCAAWI